MADHEHDLPFEEMDLAEPEPLPDLFPTETHLPEPAAAEPGDTFAIAGEGLADAPAETPGHEHTDQLLPHDDAPGETKDEKADEEEEEEKEKKDTILQRLRKTSPYTVILGLALVAIITAVVFLALEMKLYEWDPKATEPKLKNMVQAPALQTPASTSATA